METRTCQNCKQNFTIEPEDFAFYSKVKIPPPTFCADCRLARRMMFRNERTLYRRDNTAPDKSGEQIVSIHRPGTHYTVYDDRTWWGDSWDPMDYGREYDFSKPFFQQYKELYERIPLINLSITNMVHCEYCNVAEGDKGSFMLSASNRNEDCLYGNRMTENKQSAEMYITTRNELSYELVNSSNNYKVYWSAHAYECADSMFLYNCKNCTDCIGCVNLRNGAYQILNVQYSREAYLAEKEKLQLHTRSGAEKFANIFAAFVKKSIHKYAHNQNAKQSTGDNLENTNNLVASFDINEAQDCRRVVWGGYGLRDSLDAGPGVGIQAELLYDCIDTALQDNSCFWTVVVYHSFDIRYSINCHSSSHLFGCHGLRSKQYCILNKQYTKEEYEVLLPKIIEHMKEVPYVDEKGRVFTYGEFFPYDLSPFAYNETIAQEYFPLSKQDALSKGYQWYEREERNYSITVKNTDIPDAFESIEDGIVKEVLECRNKGSEISQCTTAFRIMPTELELYKKLRVPLPAYCPNCRHYNRLQQRNAMKLYHRTCMCDTTSHGHDAPCHNEFETSYAPDRSEIIYCESCYQKEVL